ERAAGTDPDRAAHPELGELLEDDRRARPTHPCRLDAQGPPGGRLPRVPPEPASVVAHPGLGEQLLGEGERPAGITGEQRVLRVVGARPEMVWHGRAPYSGVGEPARG